MFSIAFSNVVLTLLYILPGYILGKSKKANEDHLSTLSCILIYVCSPCMIVNAYINMDFEMHQLINMGLFFVISLALMALFLLIIYALVRTKYVDARYRILSIGAILGNVGFFGIPIIQALLPENPEAVAYASVYVVSMNLLVFTVGVYALTLEKEYMTIKAAIYNPTTISFFVAIPLYILGAKAYMPVMLLDAIALMAKMTTPLCMLILGIRLSAVVFKDLFRRPFVYAVCALKLIGYPLFCFACVYFLPLEYSFKATILILGSVPCASVILNMAEIHHSETELSANCVLLSTLICFITIPMMTLILG